MIPCSSAALEKSEIDDQIADFGLSCSQEFIARAREQPKHKVHSCLRVLDHESAFTCDN